jgi:YegS/Rv2252/BmrU family lipid kinase
MRKAALLYNPLSGPRRERRLADVEAASQVLRSAGVEVSTAPTRSAADTGGQVRDAIAAGYDTIFACGGDGTVHDVLQGMVGSRAALGIIPLGTANALAHDLRLPLSPVAAARAALTAKARRIAVGRVEYQDFSGNRGSRYFTVAVGIGVDAHLFYKLNPLAKSRLGMAAYYAKATRLWLTHPLEEFDVELSDADGGKRKHVAVSQLLAVRIRNFGGVLRELAPGASLDRDDLRLVLFRTRSRITYLRYILRGLLATAWKGSSIELVSSSAVTCRPLESEPASRIFVEADGELLGALPAGVTMVSDAVTLLAT